VTRACARLRRLRLLLLAAAALAEWAIKGVVLEQVLL